jgi:hypothetical protein
MGSKLRLSLPNHAKASPAAVDGIAWFWQGHKEAPPGEKTTRSAQMHHNLLPDFDNFGEISHSLAAVNC